MAKTVLTSEPETDKESAYYDALAKPVVAYENVNGTNGTVTLSVSATKYKSCRITYKNSDGQYGSTTVSHIGDTTCTTYGTIIRKNGNNTAIMINSALFVISGNAISIQRNSQINTYIGGSSDNDSNQLYITKVELWN